MTRCTLSPVAVVLVSCWMSVGCASMGRKDRGPEVVLDRYLAPVSSAVLAKVPSCQTGEQCAERAPKATVAQAPALPEPAATAAETTTPTEATAAPVAETAADTVAPAPDTAAPAEAGATAVEPPPTTVAPPSQKPAPSAEITPATPEQRGL
jgi:hypothetical protein